MSRWKALAAWILLAACPATWTAAGERGDGWSRPRYAAGQEVVGARTGSLREAPPEASSSPFERGHYLRSAEWMAAARAEAYVNPGIPAARALGRDVATSVEPLTSRAPRRRATFNGLDRASSGYLGTTGFPPDASVSAGPDKILQATNVAVRLTTRGGTEIDRLPLNVFLGHDSPDVLFDPKVYFDRLSERFFVVALEFDGDDNRSGIWLAISKTDDPAALSAPSDFCTYRIQGKRGASSADYPSIGINENWFAISVNNFRFSNGNFRRAHVYVMPVSQITDNAGSCPALGVKRFNVRLDTDGLPAFTIQPAQHYSTTDLPGKPLFMVSSSALVPSSAYHLWRITEGPTGAPQLSRQKVVGDFAYFIPPVAPQRGDAGDLDSGDTRMMQAAFRGGKLWTVHATACGIGDLPNESCIRALEITPTANGASITFSETYGRADTFLFWPGVAVNQVGDVAVAFQRSSAATYLGVSFNGKRATASGFDGLRKLRVGSCSLDNFDSGFGLHRTGDYVGLQTDPLDELSFWITGEFAGTVAGFGCDWKTRVGRARY